MKQSLVRILYVILFWNLSLENIYLSLFEISELFYTKVNLCYLYIVKVHCHLKKIECLIIFKGTINLEQKYCFNNFRIKSNNVKILKSCSIELFVIKVFFYITSVFKELSKHFSFQDISILIIINIVYFKFRLFRFIF